MVVRDGSAATVSTRGPMTGLCARGMLSIEYLRRKAVRRVTDTLSSRDRWRTLKSRGTRHEILLCVDVPRCLRARILRHGAYGFVTTSSLLLHLAPSILQWEIVLPHYRMGEARHRLVQPRDRKLAMLHSPCTPSSVNPWFGDKEDQR